MLCKVFVPCTDKISRWLRPAFWVVAFIQDDFLFPPLQEQKMEVDDEKGSSCFSNPADLIVWIRFSGSRPGRAILGK